MSPDERALLQHVGFEMLESIAYLTPSALLYGMTILLFPLSTLTLLQRGLASRPTQAMLGTTLIAFLLSSLFCISLISNFATAIQMILVDSAGMLEESILEKVNERIVVFASIQSVTSVLMPILSDGVVIWRAWVLYPDKQWILLLPCALIFCTIGASVAYLVLAFKGIENPLLASFSTYLFPASLALSLGTNVAATSLIFYRLWAHLRFVRRMGIKQNSTSPVQKILIVLVESGLAYCALQITMVVLQYVPAPPVSSVVIAEWIVLSLLTLVTAMYPSIVIMLVSQQRSTVETFGFITTQVGIRSVQDVELSSARPASLGPLSAVNPLDGQTHISNVANADGGPAGKVSATSTEIGQIRANHCT